MAQTRDKAGTAARVITRAVWPNAGFNLSSFYAHNREEAVDGRICSSVTARR